MKVAWFIEKNGFDADYAKKVAENIRLLGHKVVETLYVPMSNDVDEIEYSKGVKVEDGDCVIAFTSINLAKVLKIKRPQWFPCLWADFDKLKCSHYYSIWGEYIVQKNYAFLPFNEIKRRKEWVYQTFANSDGKVFIRPDDNTKSFSGEIVHIDMFDKFCKSANFYENVTNVLSVVSTPVKIHNEWRFIIADNKVLTGSCYRQNNDIQYEGSWEQGASEFAEKIAATGLGPHRIYVMDICKTDEGYRLMEIGSVNMAGLYSCNILSFVQKASEIAIEEYKEAYE